MYIKQRIWAVMVLMISLVLVSCASSPLVQTFSGHTDSVSSVVFSPDGKQVLTSSYDGKVLLWEPATGKSVQTLVNASAPIWSVVYAPDGKQVVTGSADKTARLWNIQP